MFNGHVEVDRNFHGMSTATSHIFYTISHELEGNK